MEKAIVNSLKVRYELVKSRTIALVKEAALLEKEGKALEELLNVYSSMPYDSIEEERSVTEHLVEKKKRKLTGSKYDEFFDAIWTGDIKEKYLTAEQIINNIYLLGTVVYKNQINSVMYRAVNNGSAVKTVIGRKVAFKWLGVK